MDDYIESFFLQIASCDLLHFLILKNYNFYFYAVVQMQR